MSETQSHLSEEELQSLADGTLSPEKTSDARAHLRGCEACAADVAHIERLMKKVADMPTPMADLDESWPSIRARIEDAKIVALRGGPPPRRHHLGIWLTAAAATAATIVVVFAYRGRVEARSPDAVAVGNITLIAASDSAREYEDEAQTLLNQLELRRATLRPETAEALNRNLKEVDGAIAELEDAIAHDPRNGTLRQLLASSYRQKVDLLKRVSNAS